MAYPLGRLTKLNGRLSHARLLVDRMVSIAMHGTEVGPRGSTQSWSYFLVFERATARGRLTLSSLHPAVSVVFVVLRSAGNSPNTRFSTVRQ
jgi:hypothetical protein